MTELVFIGPLDQSWCSWPRVSPFLVSSPFSPVRKDRLDDAKEQIGIDGGGAAGTASVSDRGGDHDDGCGDSPRLHDVSHQARPLLLVDLLQTDVGLRG